MLHFDALLGANGITLTFKEIFPDPVYGNRWIESFDDRRFKN